MQLGKAHFREEFGFYPPSDGVLRIYNGIDPHDETETKPYTGKPTLEQYRRSWAMQSAQLDGCRCIHRKPNGEIKCKTCASTPEEKANGGRMMPLFQCQHGSQVGSLCTILPVTPADGTEAPIACSTCTLRQPHKLPTKKLTIGMASVDDAMRVRWVVRSLLMFHAEVMADTEIIIVDNGSDAEQRKHLDHISGQNPGVVRVVECTQRGTFPPKAAVFDHAAGEIVIVIDSHVLIEPGALFRLIQWFADNLDFDGLATAKLLSDGGEVMATGMKPTWGNAFGQWSIEPNPSNLAAIPVEMCGAWFFACRRSAWPSGKIPQGLRGYGGDEWIGRLFKSLGREVVCLRDVSGWHDFWNRGAAYCPPEITEQHRADRLRNDMLWMKACRDTHNVDNAIECHLPSFESIAAIAKELNMAVVPGSAWLSA